MELIPVLIFISISIALLFLGAFFWATRSGQFDDTEGPAVRMLEDQVVKKRKSADKK